MPFVSIDLIILWVDFNKLTIHWMIKICIHFIWRVSLKDKSLDWATFSFFIFYYCILVLRWLIAITLFSYFSDCLKVYSSLYLEHHSLPLSAISLHLKCKKLAHVLPCFSSQSLWCYKFSFYVCYKPMLYCYYFCLNYQLSLFKKYTIATIFKYAIQGH